MIEKIKRINNPLTIIAIFAALAEINATIAIGLINVDLQSIFIWFIIGFPLLLVLLFFLTLNFNTKVMYSPSDYKDDKSFIDSLYGSGSKRDLLLPNPQAFISESINIIEKNIAEILEKKLEIPAKKTFTEKEVQDLISSYMDELKVVSEKAIQKLESNTINLNPKLLQQIVKWIIYPAFLPIIYAIIKENATSYEDLKKVEYKYHFIGNWDNNGLSNLFNNNILLGNKDQFSVNLDFKDSIIIWITKNEEVIKEIIDIFSTDSDQKTDNVMSKARGKAQKLIFN